MSEKKYLCRQKQKQMARSKEMEAKMQAFKDAGKYEQDQFIDFEPEGHVYTYNGDRNAL